MIPVLLPIDESTCERRVVGILTKGIPLKKVEEIKPAKSPTTPPPNAKMQSDLEKLFLQRKL